MSNTLNKNKIKKIAQNTFGTLLVPAVFFVVLYLVCIANGKMFLSSTVAVNNFFSYATIVTITTFALSINLNSGRFDFSLGSIATLSSLLSAKITYAMLSGGNGSAIVMLLIGIVVGAVLGFISGGLYVLLKLPPIITSLGVTLIYEGICFVLFEGRYVMKEVQNSSMSAFSGNWYPSVIVLVLVFAVIYYLFDKTKFGADYRALKEGQKVAVNTGIKEIPNAILCYTICGALMAIVGFITATRNTTINSSALNFGSIGVMFTAFLPMFIGGYIGRSSNDKLGYVIAGFCMSLLNATFAVFSNEIDGSVRSIVEAVLLVVFLIYLNNEQTCKDIITFKHLRTHLAKKVKEEK